MTMRTFPSTIEVNLDGASRSTIIAAACVVMPHGGARASDLGEWRQRWQCGTCHELLHRAAEATSRYRRGNRPCVASTTSKPLTLSPL